LPCSGRYSVGGLHTDYLRSLRLKREIEIEDGFVKADRDDLASFYLGPTKMVIEECDFGEEKCIVRGTIPVPIRSIMSDDIESAINMARNADRNIVFETWNGAIITDRDKGLFDNLNELFSKWNKMNVRKLIIDSLKLKKSMSQPSPYHALKVSLEEQAGLKITGLLLEVADTINEVLCYNLSHV
jgi:hypothetical protein